MNVTRYKVKSKRSQKHTHIWVLFLCYEAEGKKLIYYGKPKFNAIEMNKDVSNNDGDGSDNNSTVDESWNITHQNHNPNQMSLICFFFAS